MRWRWVILEEQGKSGDENYIREQHIHEKLFNWRNPDYIYGKTTLFHLIFALHPHICTGTDETFDLFICWKTITSFERTTKVICCWVPSFAKKCSFSVQKLLDNFTIN